MAEKTAKIVITVICYDCEPEDVAARMAAKMPDDVAWYDMPPAGEFEITDAHVAEG